MYSPNIIYKEQQKYTFDQVLEVYNLPFLDLIFNALKIHKQHQPQNKVQLCTLSNIKSGNCPEDCKYCPQSSRYKTNIEKYKLLTVGEILKQAQTAKESGASRFCMGAAWRNIPDGEEFQSILDSVKAVSKLDMEVCCTLGMLTREQAFKLKEAGLTAYNHNLDTSESYYNEIITTRTYNDRLQTLQYVSEANIQVCCGGIIGLGENKDDRINLLKTLTNLIPQPESVPINMLVRVKGTPLENENHIDPFEMIRTIATSRILMPRAKVRLSAGRLSMTEEIQALCFLAGANSIFIGEKLLTTGNPDVSDDMKLFSKLKLEPM